MVSDMDALVEQTQWDGFWLPPWARVVDRPELRYTTADVDQPALHLVLRVRDRDAEGGPVSLAALVDEVDAAHRGRSSRWMLAPGSQLPALPPLLERAGWRPEHLHHLRTLPVTAAAPPAPPGLEVRPVADRTTLVDCIGVTAAAFETDPGPLSTERVRDELGAIQRGRVHRFVVYDSASGTPLSSGGLNTYPRQGIGFLWGGGTVPTARGRGAYRALLQARLRRAARCGCTHVAVYARVDTSDPIVARLGFTRHGTLQTWHRAP